MKKYLLVLSLIFASFAFSVWAITLDPPIEATSIPEVLGRLTNFFFTLSLYLLPIVIVVGGIFFVTAGENAEQVEKGKKIITFGLIGFIILLTAAGLVAIIRQGLQVR